MKISLTVSVLLLLSLPATALSDKPPDATNFLYSAIIQGPIERGDLYRVPLSAEVLRSCGRDCADLRIFDQDKREIPYVIIESRGSASGGEKYNFEILGFEENRRGETVTLGLPESHKAITSIRIFTQSRDFKKKALVYGSRDLKGWNLIGEDSIWDFSSRIDLRKTHISFPESDYRYYKLVFSNAANEKLKEQDISLKYREGEQREFEFSLTHADNKRFRIDSAEGSTPKTKIKAIYDETSYPRFYPRKKDNCTILDIETSVPFERVLFDIADTYYFRRVNLYFSPDGKEETYAPVAYGQVYSFPLGEKKETWNLVDLPVSREGHYRFVVENGSNRPLEIRNIRLQWVRKNLYFMAPNDSPQYTVRFGNPALKKPEYDIVHFVNQCNWQMHSARELSMGKAERTSDYPPAVSAKKDIVEKAILISIVTLLVVFIGYWLYSLVRTANFGGRGGTER